MESRKMNDGFFIISRLHREDLSNLDFDASNVGDGTMEQLCEKMHESIMSEIYWEALENAAEELGIPRKWDED